MPRIISTGSTKASIEAIKKYFCSEYAVELVAQQTGINYDELIGGEYKLLLEPIAYFKHNGIMYAMTPMKRPSTTTRRAAPCAGP